MTNTFFVRIKAATLFTLVVVVPLAALSSILFFVENPTTSHTLLGLWFSILYGGSLTWMWVFFVGSYLSRVQSTTTEFGYRLFKTGVVFLVVMLWIVLPLSQFTSVTNSKLLSALLLAVHVAAVVLIYYVMAYLAKLVVDTEKIVAFNGRGFIATFLALLVFPFGIWFVQPRINKIYRIKGSPDKAVNAD